MVIDYEGIVLYANQAGASMFGHSTEELQAKPLGYPLADADKTELDFCSVQIAEMRVVEIEWFERPAYLITLRDLTEHNRTQQRLAYLARHDDLTGLINRSQFCAGLDMAIDRAKRRRSRLAAAFFDRDLFKPVNNTYEYDQGEALLKGLADRLSNACRAGEFVGRLAGYEFTILAEDINPPMRR